MKAAVVRAFSEPVVVEERLDGPGQSPQAAWRCPHDLDEVFQLHTRGPRPGGLRASAAGLGARLLRGRTARPGRCPHCLRTLREVRTPKD